MRIGDGIATAAGFAGEKSICRARDCTGDRLSIAAAMPPSSAADSPCIGAERVGVGARVRVWHMRLHEPMTQIGGARKSRKRRRSEPCAFAAGGLSAQGALQVLFRVGCNAGR